MKTVVTKEEVYTHGPLETGGTPCHACGVQGHMGKHQGRSLYCGFHGKEQVGHVEKMGVSWSE